MIGIDLVFLPEFEKRLTSGGAAFMQRAFGESEVTSNALDHLAGLWAAKEAVMKAASPQPKTWRDIIISYDTEDRPWAHVGSQSFEISIAHHGEYAVAVAQSQDKT